jgi:hypothetical protein
MIYSSNDTKCSQLKFIEGEFLTSHVYRLAGRLGESFAALDPEVLITQKNHKTKFDVCVGSSVVLVCANFSGEESRGSLIALREVSNG